MSYLWQLLGNVSTYKHSLQVDPEVLYDQPTLNNLSGVRKLLYPELDVLFERSIVPGNAMSLMRKVRQYGVSKFLCPNTFTLNMSTDLMEYPYC